MAIPTEFTTLPLDRLRDTAHRMKDEGWRFIQTHAVYNEPDVDLYYSFMKDGKVQNWRIEGVKKDQPVPSITDIFLAAFVFENEARELFGVDMRDIAIDFQGALYAPAEAEPMRVITPEQKAAIDKARKAAAAKAAKKAAPGAGASEQPTGNEAAASGKRFVMTPEKRERFEAKLEGRTPEQIEKARACLAAKEAASAGAPTEAPAKKQEAPEKAVEQPKAAPADAAETPVPDEPARDGELEAKIAIMDPEKAEKVKAALARRSGIAEPETASDQPSKQAAEIDDAELEAKLGLMSDEKAEKVRAALARRASVKGGE